MEELIKTNATIARIAVVMGIVALLLNLGTVHVFNGVQEKQNDLNAKVVSKLIKISSHLGIEGEGQEEPKLRAVSLRGADVTVEETRYQGCSFLIFTVPKGQGIGIEVELLHDPQCKNSSFNHTIIAAHGIGK